MRARWSGGRCRETMISGHGYWSFVNPRAWMGVLCTGLLQKLQVTSFVSHWLFSRASHRQNSLKEKKKKTWIRHWPSTFETQYSLQKGFLSSKRVLQKTNDENENFRKSVLNKKYVWINLRTRFCSFLVHDSLKSYWTCKKRSEVFTGTKLEALTVVDALPHFQRCMIIHPPAHRYVLEPIHSFSQRYKFS
jgi:hypothetical protein